MYNEFIFTSYIFMWNDGVCVCVCVCVITIFQQSGHSTCACTPAAAEWNRLWCNQLVYYVGQLENEELHLHIICGWFKNRICSLMQRQRNKISGCPHL